MDPPMAMAEAKQPAGAVPEALMRDDGDDGDSRDLGKASVGRELGTNLSDDKQERDRDQEQEDADADAEEAEQPLLAMQKEAHARAISSCKFSRSGDLLATGSADCGLKIWDARSLELKGILPHIHTHGISDIAWDLHGRNICSASDDKCVVVSDVERRTPVLRLAGHTNYVLSVAYNAQSNLIASGSFDETVKLWDVRWGQCIKDLKAHADPVTSVDFSPNGRTLVSGSYDGLIRLWDLNSGGQCLKTVYSKAQGIPCVSVTKFTPNGKYVLASTLDGRIRLWSPADNLKVKEYSGHANTQFCVAASMLTCPRTQHTQVVSGGEDGNICVWDLQSCRMTKVLRGHTDVVLGVHTHPTEPLVASCGMGRDRSLRLWRL